MKKTLIDLFTSKKFLAALTAIIVYLGGRFGLHIDPAALDRVWQALLVYVGAQGIADLGKGAAQVAAAASTTATPAPAQVARMPGGSTVAALLLVLVGAGVALQPSCASGRERGTDAAGAFIDCESGDIAKLLPDLLPLAKEAVRALITGDGTIDMAQLRADAGAIRGDLGKCALAGAIAAVSAPMPEQAGAPRVAARNSDTAQLRGAFTNVRSELGWAPIHVSGAVL